MFLGHMGKLKYFVVVENMFLCVRFEVAKVYIITQNTGSKIKISKKRWVPRVSRC